MLEDPISVLCLAAFFRVHFVLRAAVVGGRDLISSFEDFADSNDVFRLCGSDPHCPVLADGRLKGKVRSNVL